MAYIEKIVYKFTHLVEKSREMWYAIINYNYATETGCIRPGIRRIK